MTYEFICRTDSCKSNGLISIITDPADQVICGWCHTEITDKTMIPEPAASDVPAALPPTDTPADPAV